MLLFSHLSSKEEVTSVARCPICVAVLSPLFDISDLLMSILPIILIVSVFGALVGMFRSLGKRLGGD